MKKGLSVLIIFGLVLPFFPLQAAIQPPIKSQTFGELINDIMTFILNVIIIGLPVMIVVAGLFMVTAAGEPKQIETAKNIIKYSIIGLIVALLAKGFIELLKGGLGI